MAAVISFADLLKEGSAEFVREDKSGWSVSEDGTSLSVSTKPGSIWGDFGLSLPAANTLLLPHNATTDTIQSASVTTTLFPATYGEQAGLLLYTDMGNWVKLVIEGMKDGTVAVVMASSIDGKPEVTKKEKFGAGQQMEATFSFAFKDNGSTVVGKIEKLLVQGEECKLQAESMLLSECTVPANARLSLMAHGGNDAPKLQSAVFSNLKVSSSAK